MYRVLIADDEPLMRQALSIMISKIEGFQVAFSVGTGEQAVAICKSNKIDIVFMDIMMSGEPGTESSKKIYEINPDITIFIVSAYKNFDFALEALKSKVKAYLSKPASLSQIVGLLQNYKIEHNKNSSNEGKNFKYSKLYSTIKEKDFKGIYYEIPKILDEIKSMKSKSSIKEEVINLGQDLINSTISQENPNKGVLDVLSMKDNQWKGSRYYEFWLFSVVNYIFKINSINKYPLLKNVFNYIEENIEDEIGLNEIITNCAVSQGYLSRIFKKQFNVSVMEYLHMRKINLAKRYFCFTDLSVTDVSFKLGYNESSYFSKVFKKYENITVNSYRKSI